MAADPIVWGTWLLALAGGGLLGWIWHGARSQSRRRSWPSKWNLNARPVFSVQERALYRELKAALPQHVVLAKIGLLRFCHSADETDAKAWYERLQPLHVSMAVCTPNGVVVSVIDVEPSNPKSSKSQRSQRLKEAALDACRIRYIRCRSGQWPQPNMLAAWALGQSGAGMGLPSASTDQLLSAGDKLARRLKEKRAERAAMWSESGFSHDSFFAFDSRFDAAGAANSMPASLDDFQDTQPTQDRQARAGRNDAA